VLVELAVFLARPERVKHGVVESYSAGKSDNVVISTLAEKDVLRVISFSLERAIGDQITFRRASKIDCEGLSAAKGQKCILGRGASR
jgi:hypothetical protein